MQYQMVKELSESDRASLTAEVAADEIPIVDSEIVYRISRDDGTPVGICGLIRPFALNVDRMIWFSPFLEFRPIDWRGMKRLLKILRAYCPYMYAIIEEDNRKAVRLAKACEFQPHSTYNGSGVWRWL